ncbi:Zinc finger protein [Coniochaeta hoffmannii]|uniref:Zinc finger protein n=1 Tax=Coniochaeta hoffmannii TaxID=91930 RepID=A0AA38VCD9_9PEZI|nr:Zinc finger protein [Coniochaeta hoffmannii]
MADPSRYSGRYVPASGRRSPILYNPARSSVPAGVNYAPYGGDQYAPEHYGRDIHVMPISQHDGIMTGRSAGDYRTNSIPVTTTTYAVRKDREPGVSRSASVREGSSSGRHRSSTIDTSSKRPPIIITTKHSPTNAGSHASSNARSDSPTRDPHRSSEERYYTQAGTSINRARSQNRPPHSAASRDNDDYARLRERTGDERLRAADPYRPPRQPALYPYEPRHSAAIDYGNEGYEYTKPSDLARYDLDTTRPPRSNRRDSFDRGYYRPSVSVSTDIGGHPYESNERRSRGPPPTSRGLDRLNRSAAAGIYDAPGIRMPVPPPAPLAPSRHLGVPGSPTSERRASSRTRPVSLYQDSYGYAPLEDPSRSRNDHRVSRDRDYFYDDVANRGFGLRVDPKDVDDPRRDPEPRHRDERRDRRDPRTDELDRDQRRRADEEFEPVVKRDERRERADLDAPPRKDDRRKPEDRDPNPRRRSDEEWEFVPRKEDRKPQKGSLSPPGIQVIDDDAVPPRSRRDDAADRKESKDKDRADRIDDDCERDSRKDKIKDKVAAGLGIAAASIGLGSALKDKDGKDDRKDRSSKRHSRDSDDLRSWESGDEDPRVSDRHRPSRRDADDKRRSSREEPQVVEAPRDRDGERPRRDRQSESTAESRDRNRREAEAALTGEPVEKTSRDTSTSSADDKDKPSRSRRKLRSSGFDPNDAAGLAALKAELAASEKKDRAAAGPATRDRSPERRPGRKSSPPSTEKDDPSFATALVPVPKDDDEEDYRGREIVSEAEDRQVRVVSPPRDKDEKKPVKGILKPPKPQFPEEPNPVREGVAPHKDDKKKADVPPGARWTKINRALVNPEALDIGKERFEVRDDFVIVLRVLSKEEIQAYATATAQLRERRRLELKRMQKEAEYEPEKDEDEDRRRRHRHHRRERDDEYVDEGKERERDRDDRDRDAHRRSRRHRDAEYDYDDVEERPKAIEYNGHGHEHKHHRSHRVGE